MKIDVNDLEAQRIWVEVSSKEVARYGVHAVCYDDDCEIWSCSEAPVRVEAERLEDLHEDLDDNDWALELPWLDYRHIVPDDPEEDELGIEVAFLGGRGWVRTSRLDKADYGCWKGGSAELAAAGIMQKGSVEVRYAL